MNKIGAYVRARLAFWGTRLGILASIAAGYMAANGGAVEKAINSVVPEPWRPVASMLIGLATFAIVHTASTSDAKKVANG